MYNNIQYHYTDIDNYDFLADFISIIDKIGKVIKLSLLSVILLPFLVLLVVIYYIVLFPIGLFIFYKINKEITKYSNLVMSQYTTYSKESTDEILTSISGDIVALNKIIETFGDNKLFGSKYIYNKALESRNIILDLNGKLYIHLYGDLSNLSHSEKTDYLQEVSKFQDIWN